MVLLFSQNLLLYMMINQNSNATHLYCLIKHPRSMMKIVRPTVAPIAIPITSLVASENKQFEQICIRSNLEYSSSIKHRLNI